jgi:uncharacterized OB-fold protein
MKGAVEDQLRAYVGKPTGPPIPASVAVNEAMIRHWCEALGDTNPRYVERGEAPPTMLLSWVMASFGEPPVFRRGAVAELMALLDEVGYTSVVATDTEEEYARYLKVGERVTMTTVIDGVSDEKATALGPGRFLSVRSTFATDQGEVVGSARFRYLKFKPADRTAEPPPPRPRPPVNRDNEFFWDGALEGELRIQRCASCKQLRHPPGPMCPTCRSLDWDYVVASGRGTVYSHVVHHYPPMPQFGSPHNVVLVELEEGVRFVSNLADVDAADIKIGMPVRVRFTRIEDDYVLPQFEVAS